MSSESAWKGITMFDSRFLKIYFLDTLSFIENIIHIQAGEDS